MGPRVIRDGKIILLNDEKDLYENKEFLTVD